MAGGFISTVRSLLVACAGGHLAELRAARERLLDPSAEVTWVTWSEGGVPPQVASGDTSVLIQPVSPKSPFATMSLLRTARRILAAGDFDEVVSTGALPAVPFMLVARARGLRCRYLESAARVDGPSLTGRILEWVPGVERYCQYPSWAKERPRRGWACQGSVFDSFRPGPPQHPRIERALVMVGSSAFPFDRLLDAALQVLPTGCDVVWQTGTSVVAGLPSGARALLPERELAEAAADADVVISHAGVGSALCALAAGSCPVLVPRRASRHEHTDDHQVALARHLASRGLAVASEVESLTPGIVATAAARSVLPMTGSLPASRGDVALAGAPRGPRASS